MARADRAVIDAGTPAEVLMDRAGRAVGRACIRLLGSRYGRRVAIVCGKGSNGGDGFAAGWFLTREGVAARCLTVGAAGTSGPASIHRERAEHLGVDVGPFEPARLEGADLIVDALFGTGFRGSPGDGAARAIAAMNATPAPVVAVDVPSGIDGATGAIAGPAVHAKTTVALGAEKLGTALSPGAARSGDVEICDIGIPPPPSDVRLTEEADVARVVPRRDPAGHKRSRGSVVIVAGSTGMSGAAVLTTLGALHAGAGYVTVATTAEVERVLAVRAPEAVNRVVTQNAHLGPECLEDLAGVLRRSSVLALGPGLGEGSSQSALVLRALDEVTIPMVVDADAVNALGGDGGPLARRRAPTVITPHPGELSRLTGVPTDAIQADRLGAARAASKELGCVVVLKGFRTVIAAPSGSAVVNPSGGSELSSAGTGDVLTGVIAAFVAAGLDPMTASWAGAYVHGIAGSAVAVGATASLVAAAIPHSLGTLAR